MIKMNVATKACASSYHSAFPGTYSTDRTSSSPRGQMAHTAGEGRVRLEHHRYDTFVTRFDKPALERAYVTFSLGAEGAISGVTMKPVLPVADFSWDYQDLMFLPKATQ